MDLELDNDPYYEYDKCDYLSFIEKKLEDKCHNFEPIQISTFDQQLLEFEQPNENIVEEMDKLLKEKFHKIMSKLVWPKDCVDNDEIKLFKAYNKK